MWITKTTDCSDPQGFVTPSSRREEVGPPDFRCGRWSWCLVTRFRDPWEKRDDVEADTGKTMKNNRRSPPLFSFLLEPSSRVVVRVIGPWTWSETSDPTTSPVESIRLLTQYVYSRRMFIYEIRLLKNVRDRECDPTRP